MSFRIIGVQIISATFSKNRQGMFLHDVEIIQAKEEHPFEQPSVRCCKIVVIEGLSKFMSFLQKNSTTDWSVATTH